MASKILFIELKNILLKKVKIAGKQEYLFASPRTLWALRQAVDLGYKVILLNFRPLLTGRESALAFSLLLEEGIGFEIIAPDVKPAELTSCLAGTSLDRDLSLFVGASAAARKLAGEMGIALRSPGKGAKGFTGFEGLAAWLRERPRAVTVSRTTGETTVKVTLNLDGKGSGKVSTGLKFLDHMLDLLGCHAGLDLVLKARGDLEVDEHHTVEDTAIVLGQAVRKALGDKRGIARYGFVLPMDESLALCAIDFSGRPALVFSAALKRERVGDLPTELVRHFFESFAVHAGATLNLELRGENEHHMIEAAFKALGRSLKQAFAREGSTLPSTKGHLE